MNKKRKQVIKENIYNIPNLLTALRVIITLIIIYGVFSGFKFLTIAVLFVIGMITDAADGQIARRFHEVTEFGRKFDMVADRFLLIGTIASLIIYNSFSGMINSTQLIQIFIILSREIIGFPFVIIGLFKATLTPHATIVAKATTVLQTLSFPWILLNLPFSWIIVILTSIFGIASGIRYASDTLNKNQKFPEKPRLY